MNCEGLQRDGQALLSYRLGQSVSREERDTWRAIPLPLIAFLCRPSSQGCIEDMWEKKGCTAILHCYATYSIHTICTEKLWEVNLLEKKCLWFCLRPMSVHLMYCVFILYSQKLSHICSYLSKCLHFCCCHWSFYMRKANSIWYCFFFCLETVNYKVGNPRSYSTISETGSLCMVMLVVVMASPWRRS